MVQLVKPVVVIDGQVGDVRSVSLVVVYKAKIAR